MIKGGSILVTESAALPDCMKTGDETYARAWKVVNNVEAYGLDRAMDKIGWSFLHSAPPTKAIAIGFGRRNAVGNALGRLLAKLKHDKFNCLEIKTLAARRVLGITCITIAADPRNLLFTR